MEIHKIKKPNISSIDFGVTLEKLKENGDWWTLIHRATSPKYLPWQKVQHFSVPETVTAEEFWFVIKKFREYSPTRRQSVIKAESGKYFTWDVLPDSEALNHKIDMELGGNLKHRIAISNDEKIRFISRGIMEEAIASSQLEGANTTRKAAQMMLREGRKPRTNSEHMIVNNFEAMSLIESELKNRKLDVSLLFELHEILVKNTDIAPAGIGKFRRDEDNVVVCNSSEDVIYHVAPKEEFLKEEINRLIAYANDDITDLNFIHPVTKAIFIHFWIGYLHPFIDGNGRLARVLFYWYLLKRDYWAFSYLPLSKVIKSSHGQYRDAYLQTEQDDYDLNYFLDFNQRKIRGAMAAFESYLNKHRTETRRVYSGLRAKYNLNESQVNMIRFLAKNTGQSISYKGYATFNGVTRLTARKHLKYLEENELLESYKESRTIQFVASKKLKSITK